MSTIALSATVDLSAVIKAAVHQRIEAMRAQLVAKSEEASKAHAATERAYDAVLAAIHANPPAALVPYLALQDMGFRFCIEWTTISDAGVEIDVPHGDDPKKRSGRIRAAVNLADAHESVLAAMREHDRLAWDYKAIDAAYSMMRAKLEDRGLREALENEAMAAIVRQQSPQIQALIDGFANGGTKLLG